jgi:biotin synthase
MVTINLTPPDLQRNYVIYKRDRFIMDEERVLSAIAAEGFSPSRQSLADFFQNGAPDTVRAEAVLSAR